MHNRDTQFLFASLRLKNKTGEMVRCKHEGLSSNPRTHIYIMLVVIVHVCSPSIPTVRWEVETGEFLQARGPDSLSVTHCGGGAERHLGPSSDFHTC